MRTWTCCCGAEIFFHNTRCVACGRDVGMCESCNQVHSLEDLVGTVEHKPSIAPVKTCPADSNVQLVRCANGVNHAVCNRYYVVQADPEVDTDIRQPCQWCKLTTEHPATSDPDRLLRWRQLEAAKRRTLYIVDQIGLPVLSMPGELPLSFRFPDGSEQPVVTGHAGGVITIDAREADSVHREATRVEFGEPHRTLVGHFRHELGHYYWQRLVEPDMARLDEYRQLFGDERTPSYQEAQKDYYARGVPVAWQGHFVSQYATMHSWEDFAESFNAYLDMRTVLATAAHFVRPGGVRQRVFANSAPNDPSDRFEKMIADYARVGIVANEFNRDLGLLDLVPEVFTTSVVKKLRFIHNLCNPAAELPTIDESDSTLPQPS
ncbi:MAG: putative zinc-binding metallopeptidase [Planctomycetota bacterium]